MTIDGEAFVSQEFKTPLAIITVVFFVVSTMLICFCSYCTENVVNLIKGIIGSTRNQPTQNTISPLYAANKSKFTDRPDIDIDSINSSEITTREKIQSKVFRYGSCPAGYKKFGTISKYKEDEEEFDEKPGCYISAV